MNQTKMFVNRLLGRVQTRRLQDSSDYPVDKIWNAVQIDVDAVRLWQGLNDSFFVTLEKFNRALRTGQCEKGGLMNKKTIKSLEEIG